MRILEIMKTILIIGAVIIVIGFILLIVIEPKPATGTVLKSNSKVAMVF